MKKDKHTKRMLTGAVILVSLFSLLLLGCPPPDGDEDVDDPNNPPPNPPGEKRVVGLTLNPSGGQSMLVGGQTVTVTATVQPADTTEPKTVKWTSTDTASAIVSLTPVESTDGNNQVTLTAVAEGEATITVTTDGKNTAGNPISRTFTVTVSTPLTSLTLNQTSISYNAGEGDDPTFQLIATVLPESASNKTVLWESSNPNIAAVDEDGLVTVSTDFGGSATITATTVGRNLQNQQLTATCQVSVVADITDLGFGATYTPADPIDPHPKDGWTRYESEDEAVCVAAGYRLGTAGDHTEDGELQPFFSGFGRYDEENEHYPLGEAIGRINKDNSRIEGIDVEPPTGWPASVSVLTAEQLNGDWTELVSDDPNELTGIGYMKFTITVAETGYYRVNLYYNGNDNKKVVLKLNEGRFKVLTLPAQSGGAWDTLYTRQFLWGEFQEGENTLWISGSIGGGWANFDCVDVRDVPGEE